jgi:histidine ammonia-lyase
MSHLWSRAFEDPALLQPEAMAAVSESGGGLLMYAAATRYAELRALAGPVTLDIPPLDLGVEDHATNAPGAVFATDAALDALDDILAVELLMARETLRHVPETSTLGVGVRAAFEELAAIQSTVRGSPEELHASVRDGLHRIVSKAFDATADPGRSGSANRGV